MHHFATELTTTKMTHEFISILNKGLDWKNQGFDLAIATVVHLQGSSYRRPGVSMLINDNLDYFGAVSGGCVEKAILQQARAVFSTGSSKLMTYDGRIRLGCEGVLTILIEPFNPDKNLKSRVNLILEKRKSFKLISSFNLKDDDSNKDAHSVMEIDGAHFNLASKKYSAVDFENHFTKEFLPPYRLIIFGTEHDAVSLSETAENLGWQIELVYDPKETIEPQYFSKINKFYPRTFESVSSLILDSRSAVVLMSHSYTKDLEALVFLSKLSRAPFIGLLGPAKRRSKLIDDLSEVNHELDPDFLDCVFGPIGLDLGAETAQEISLSICAQILSYFRLKDSKPLYKTNSSIHA